MSVGNLFTFGRKHTLLATILQPRQNTDQHFHEGVIVVGMGMPEVKVARGLSRLGFLVMQVRLIADFAEFDTPAKQRPIFDESGVERMQEAMNYLQDQFGVERFHLMGTCATANLAVNTALIDSRVVGLIPLNMHFTEHLTYKVSLKQKIFKWSSWKRLLSGKANYRWHKHNLQNIARGASRSEVASQWTWHKDILLPVEIENALQALIEEGVHLLVIYSRSEPELYYFRQVCGKVLAKWESSGRFSLRDCLETHTLQISQLCVGAGWSWVEAHHLWK
jgi:hypothetical protein